MGNIGFTGKEITKKLDNKTIRNGGLKLITMPIAKCKVASELETMTVEVGGYPSFTHYNKAREEQHNKDKWNQSMRKLRRNIRNKKLGQQGLTHNVKQTTDLERDFNS